MDFQPDRPLAHRIANDQEALVVAAELATQFAAEATIRDRERRLPRAEVEAFSASGLWAITVPQRLGGADVSIVTLAQVVALISAADPSLGQIPQNHFALLERLRVHGAPEQQAHLFSRVLAGDRLGNASAEPGDLRPKDHHTRLRQTADGLRLTGKKVYATGALFAHWIPVSAIDDSGEGVTIFVPHDAPGLTIIDDWSGFGQKTTASGTVLLDAVPIDPALVFRNRQTKPPLDTTNAVSQIVHAAVDLGIARAALDDTQRFLRDLSHPARGSGAARATDDPIALRDLGALIVHYHAAEALTERAARLVDAARGREAPAAAAQALIAVVEAKILTTEIALKATNSLFELAGTQATREAHGLDRHWRNARTHTLHDGIRWKYHTVAQFNLNGLICDPWTLGHPYAPRPEPTGEA